MSSGTINFLDAAPTGPTPLDGVSMETVAAELLDLTIAVASGRPSKSEAQGVGEAEFNPWLIGGTL